MIDFIIGALILIAVIFAVRSIRNKKGSGGCHGCSGCSSARACGNYESESEEKLKK
ncbi:MAG: FeoB-associated Cys-rich membrane protein [Clostridia bacterium]|nr:FeoB-associated Cys-rich membrane protein [Clostridia bacterium]